MNVIKKPDLERSQQPDLMAELGMIGRTAPRFSLVRPGCPPEECQDIITQPSPEGFSRYLVVNQEVMDDNTYIQLNEAGIPQLPVVAEVGQEGNKSIVFAVRDGLKPLAKAALFARESSETYISDGEIFHQLGRLYKQAWSATGQILLDPGVPTDSPLHHVAIHNFADSEHILVLTPPYSPGTDTLPHDAALKRFVTTLETELAARSTTYADQMYNSQYPELIEAARQGFLEV